MKSLRHYQSEPPEVEVVIEVPRGSFLKRGSTGKIDFVSPLPCPFNYGYVPDYIGGEGDYLDAVVLGPRLPLGSRVKVKAWGAIGLSERFMYDDKLICSHQPLSARQCSWALRFFHFYAICKGWLNFWRGRQGATHCEGWGEAGEAIARATPATADWPGPRISF